MLEGISIKSQKLWLYSAVIGFIVGTIVAVLVMAVAWLHNPQGEIHLEARINWFYWLSIGFAWFVLSFLVVTLLARSLFGLVPSRRL